MLSQRRAFIGFSDRSSLISQLGQIASDDDATCDVPNRGVYQYVEVKEHRMLLSQRRYKSQLLQLGQIGDDSDATCSGSSEGVLVIRRSAGPQMLLS